MPTGFTVQPVVKNYPNKTPLNTALSQLAKNRRIRFYEVRSEGKLLMSLLGGWAMIGA
jgi:hypothetical protein